MSRRAQSFAAWATVMALLTVSVAAETQPPDPQPPDPEPVPGPPPVVDDPEPGRTGGTDDGFRVPERRGRQPDRIPTGRSETRRSVGRTVTGLLLAGAGAYTTVYASKLKEEVDLRVGSESIVHGASKDEYEMVGLGLLGIGVLLATVWSDVDVDRTATIIITPDGGFMASRSFGW